MRAAHPASGPPRSKQLGELPRERLSKVATAVYRELEAIPR